MTLPPDLTLLSEVPGADEYCRLRVAAGMGPKSEEAALAGLPNTSLAAVIRKDQRLVAMGRVVGDGGLFFQLVDIAVHPDYQGRGLGKAIVATLVDGIRATAHPGAYVSLMVDGQTHHLYAQFGFAPTAPASIGMAFTLP